MAGGGTVTKFAHELEPGDFYEPLVVTVTTEMNQQILFAQEQFGATYIAGPGDGNGALVCPALLLQLCANTKSPSFKLAPGTGSILAEASTRFHGAAYVGRRLRVSWRVTSVYEKRGRCYYVMQAAMCDDEDGRAIMTRHLHLTFSTAT
jgi:acyl dehydratase